jgi:hypothetical protein
LAKVLEELEQHNFGQLYQGEQFPTLFNYPTAGLPDLYDAPDFLLFELNWDERRSGCFFNEKNPPQYHF